MSFLRSERLMSDRERRARNKANAYLATGSAGLGLAAAGARGGSYMAGRAAKAGKVVRISQPSLERTSTGLTTAGVGVGSVWSLNGAKLSYDASRRKAAPVSKSIGLDFGLDGVTQGDSGRCLAGSGSLVPVSKSFDSERSRLRRRDRFDNAAPFVLGAAGAGLGAESYIQGRKAFSGGTRVAGPKGTVYALNVNGKRAGRAGAFGLAALGSAVAADRISSYRRSENRKSSGYRPLYRPGA